MRREHFRARTAPEGDFIRIAIPFCADIPGSSRRRDPATHCCPRLPDSTPTCGRRTARPNAMGRPGVRWPDLGCPPDPALSPPVHRSRPRQPWSAEEHSRFLDALDRADAGDSAGVWRSIAHRVGARPVHEVKLHAHKYFLRLHAAGAAKAAAPPDASLRRPWTHREDAAFEDAVAEVGEGAGPFPGPRPAAPRRSLTAPRTPGPLLAPSRASPVRCCRRTRPLGPGRSLRARPLRRGGAGPVRGAPRRCGAHRGWGDARGGAGGG